MKSCFLLRGSPEGGPSMAAGQDRCSFTGPNAMARLPAYLQSTQALLLIIHCKYADALSCARRRRYPRIAQPVFHSRGLLGCSQGPQEKVLQIRGGHQDGHQLESLHFYSVPWPHRRGLKSSKKKPLKLTSFFKKAVSKIQIDRRLESLHFKGG